MYKNKNTKRTIPTQCINLCRQESSSRRKPLRSAVHLEHCTVAILRPSFLPLAPSLCLPAERQEAAVSRLRRKSASSFSQSSSRGSVSGCSEHYRRQLSPLSGHRAVETALAFSLAVAYLKSCGKTNKSCSGDSSMSTLARVRHNKLCCNSSNLTKNRVISKHI